MSTIYREADCAIIHKTKERFGELSNMCSGFPIEYDGKLWYSTEALYQCCRFPGRTDLHDQINVKNAMLAKMKSKPPRAQTRADWLDVRVPAMEAVLRLKIDQHLDRITDVLAMTGTMPIVEKSRRDVFWGAKQSAPGEITGENVLGLLWMLMREELRAGVFHADVELSI